MLEWGGGASFFELTVLKKQHKLVVESSCFPGGRRLTKLVDIWKNQPREKLSQMHFFKKVGNTLFSFIDTIWVDSIAINSSVLK